MSRFSNYLKETRAELKHVSWPTKRQTITYTIVSVVLSVLIAYFMGVFDFIFLKGLEAVIAL